ncbi:response regulator [bacterium]|nr:response regulator [candidate division CSSED10-310 bacterium]
MKTLLIVDDEKPFVLSLKDGFGSYDSRLHVAVAFNGEEALHYIMQHPVDLILLDLKMPIMDGYELVERLKSTGISVPIIIMTAYGTPFRERWAKAAGTVAYLEKPLDFTELTHLLETHLDL